MKLPKTFLPNNNAEERLEELLSEQREVYKEVKKVLKKLHNTKGYPRLEIEDEGEISVEIKNLKLFPLNFPEKTAVYIPSKWYNNVFTEGMAEYVFFPKKYLESLISEVVISKTKQVVIHAVGKYLPHYKTVDEYTVSHEDLPAKLLDTILQLNLEIEDDEPSFSISF